MTKERLLEEANLLELLQEMRGRETFICWTEGEYRVYPWCGHGVIGDPELLASAPTAIEALLKAIEEVEGKTYVTIRHFPKPRPTRWRH